MKFKMTVLVFNSIVFGAVYFLHNMLYKVSGLLNLWLSLMDFKNQQLLSTSLKVHELFTV